MTKLKNPYVCFIEHNDWEGETWRFYIPINGNEADLAKVRELITGSDYELVDEPQWSKAEVKKLERAGGYGYMNYHNLAAGFKQLPDSINWDEEDPFYKGGLIRYGDK